MFIPEIVKIGFQNRYDTFDGKLSYIIYYDEKNVLRKEKSWDSWRDKNINPIDINNVPTKGFIINKSIKRDNYYFGSGKNMTRIYDPRGFEFEISVDNLHGIIDHSNIFMNEIEVECIYAWDRADLILLPTNSKQYKDSLVYTNKQNEKKIATNDLVIGNEYSLKEGNQSIIFLGRYIYNYSENNLKNYPDILNGFKDVIYRTPGKVNIFYSQDLNKFFTFPAKDLYKCINSTPHDDTDLFISNFLSSKNGNYVTHVEIDYEFGNIDILKDKIVLGTIEKVNGKDYLSVYGKIFINNNGVFRVNEKRYHAIIKNNIPQLGISYTDQKIIRANSILNTFNLLEPIEVKNEESQKEALNRFLSIMKEEKIGIVKLFFKDGKTKLLSLK